MQLSQVFLELGSDSFTKLLRSISMGKLKTYQLYDRVKARTHLNKLSSETLQKSAPRQWARIESLDDEFARDIAQAILISHLDMIVDVLNFLQIPHEDGFFVKDLDPAPYLTGDWQERVLAEFKDKYSEAVLKFYMGHLAWETKASADAKAEEPQAAE